MSVKYVKEWVEKAEQDYQTILILSRQRKKFLPDVICYHAHQCIEKYLKGFLAAQGIKIPKTHNLIFLMEQLVKSYPELELIKDALRDLNQYAVELRYPGETATKKDASQAAQHVKDIRKLFLVKLV